MRRAEPAIQDLARTAVKVRTRTVSVYEYGRVRHEAPLNRVG
jgi:hypothetical protein